MTRLYHMDDLTADQNLTLTDAQNHYLRHVLRATVGHKLSVFNERDGEWLAVLTSLSKGNSSLTVESQIRPAISSPNVSLLFAPIKHDPLTFLMEKATELGIRHIHPVITQRCNISRVNHDRLIRNVIESAQQCERFDIPTIHPLMNLSKALELWDARVPLFVCQERGEVLPIRAALGSLPSKASAGFLIGPEGGFSGEEFAYLKTFSYTQFITLGPRVLRAETAALAAITCYQAIVGDWGG